MHSDARSAPQAASGPVAVTFVSSHAQLGGSERYLELLVSHLSPSWCCGVVSLQEGPFVDRLQALGLGCRVRVAKTPARLGILPAALRLRRALVREGPDVVHANGVKAALLCILATVGAKTPVVWVKHDFSWDGRLTRLLAPRAALVVGVSAAVLEPLAGAGARLRVVPHGIPEPAVDPRAGRERALGLFGGDEADHVVALMGRLHPAKGQLELIETIPAVLQRRPRSRFLFLGAEDPSQRPYAAAVRRRADQLGLAGAVRFAGYRGDALELVAGCDLLVVPSVPDERGMGREGFGLAALEAMTVGTAVLAYAGGALPEVLGDCGRLVPAGDREALAVAIDDLLGDDDERARLAACGRARALGRFRLDAMIEAMKETYTQAAATRPAPRRP